MRTHLILFFAAVLGIAACSSRDMQFHVSEGSNTQVIPDTAFESFEDLTNPKFAALKEKYQLDTTFHGERNEMRRILLLRNWISRVIKIDDYGPYAGDGSVESILDEALIGKGFHCGHFTEVQNAIMNGYGYVTRCLLADVGEPIDYLVGGGHHAINEIWVNSYSKWVLSDAKYDYHFEKDGIPLSALEVREEYLKNKASDIILVKGPDRVHTEMYPQLNISKEQIARVYTWLSWGKYNNRYSNYPNTQTDYMLFFEDDYFKNHVWLWDGKRHWAYGTEYMILINDRKAIEWTPNMIASEINIEGNSARIALHSVTPNFKSYQMKTPDGSWHDVDSPLSVELEPDTNTLAFRTINLADVTGPEHTVIISR